VKKYKNFTGRSSPARRPFGQTPREKEKGPNTEPPPSRNTQKPQKKKNHSKKALQDRQKRERKKERREHIGEQPTRRNHILKELRFSEIGRSKWALAKKVGGKTL